MSHDNHLESDKQYWHRYNEFYESTLNPLSDATKILEFGVFRGSSIRWLLNKFPSAKIFGCDILEPTEQWPISDRVQYFKMDQSNRHEIKNVFEKTGGSFDIIIEDGSHQPIHQHNCLLESIEHIKNGGIYILEDIHTSHPDHEMYKKTNKEILPFSEEPFFGPLHILLMFEQLKSLKRSIDSVDLSGLVSRSIFQPKDIKFLFDRIDCLSIYKRSTLPLKCYRCGNSNFDFRFLKCSCDAPLYKDPISMSAIIKVKSTAPTNKTYF